MKVRTTHGWAEMDMFEVRQRLAAAPYCEGPAVIEHNEFMRRYHPIPGHGLPEEPKP